MKSTESCRAMIKHLIRKLFFCHLILAGFTLYAQESLTSEDVKILSQGSQGMATKHFRQMYVRYIESPKTIRPEGSQKIELYNEAIQWYAKNQKVRKYYENLFATVPHTMSTASQRQDAFNALRDVKAEWLANIMLKELQIDRQQDATNNFPDPPLTEEEIMSRVSNGRYGDFFRNDEAAAAYLIRLQLKGMESLTVHSSLPPNYLPSMREWAEKYGSSIGVLLAEKYGGQAVLNNEMQIAERALKRRRHDRTPRKSDQSSEKTNWVSRITGSVSALSARAKWISGFLAGLIALFYFFVCQKRKCS